MLYAAPYAALPGWAIRSAIRTVAAFSTAPVRGAADVHVVNVIKVQRAPWRRAMQRDESDRALGLVLPPF